MEYPYVLEEDDGNEHWLPLVPLTVHGPKGSIANLFALVDSGAEHNVFSLALAEQLGIDVAEGQPVEITGVADAHASGQLVQIELQLGRQRWNAPVVFSEAVEHNLLLGQIGFFALFTVRFRYAERRMDIQRVRPPRLPKFSAPHHDHDSTH